MSYLEVGAIDENASSIMYENSHSTYDPEKPSRNDKSYFEYIYFALQDPSRIQSSFCPLSRPRDRRETAKSSVTHRKHNVLTGPASLELDRCCI